MSGLVCERLLGCNADSLDAYLRGLGFFLLAGQVEPSARAWWDEDGILNLASPGVDGTALRIAEAVLSGKSPVAPVETPFRGKEGKGRSFVELRNHADEALLDWFDACALPRAVASEEGTVGRVERSERENNPLLGQGGGFGRSEVAAAHRDAVSRLCGSRLDGRALAEALVRSLRGETLSSAVSTRLSTTKAVLSAYQSGRATGPGLSSRDVEPTSQKSRTNVWDLVFVIEGLRAFRGVPTRRPEPTARVQGSFPLVTRARPIGTAPGEAVEAREDSPDTFEILAPLWSQPCSARALRHLIGTARLRTERGVARDSLDAVLVQAARAARGLGFDRLVRFAFVPGSDPRYRYAVRRGSVRARGLDAARTALDEVVPFLRRVERAVREEPPGLRVGRRRLEDALAALGVARPEAGQDRATQPRQAQHVLIALALMEAAAARASREELPAPSLSLRWLRLADDGSPEYRLASVLVAGLGAGSSSLLRSTILPQGETEGRWVLDPQASPPHLERVSDPLGTLVSLSLLALRQRDRSVPLMRSGAARPEDVALLLSGSLGDEGERRLALLGAALAGIRLSGPSTLYPGLDPATAGIGADAARLMLAAQPTDDEDPNDAAWVERAEPIASLLLAGRYDVARIVADRQLRRRRLGLLPQPPLASPPPGGGSRLALAVLLPLDPEGRAALARAVSVTSTPVLEGDFR